MKSAAMKALRSESRQTPNVISRSPDAAGTSESHDLGKGIFAGLIGGLIGTIVMTQFQNAWTNALQELKSEKSPQPADSEQKQEKPESEDATMKAAGKIAELGGRQLSHEQKKKLGPMIHYSFGTLQGGIYGGLTELFGVNAGFLPGIVFGAALFGLADEVAVPALGLSGKPTESPLSSHLYGLAAHLVYGVSTEVTRRGLRAAL